MTRPPLLDILLLATALGATLAGFLLLLRDPTLRAPQTTRILLERLDRDGDGIVSRAEHDSLSNGRPPFENLDLDGNGHLDPWEVDALLVTVNPNYGRQHLQDPSP